MFDEQRAHEEQPKLCADHHFSKLYRDGAPVCLCTDDTWVFNTCLSREYEIACETFGLTMRDIHAMNVRAMDFAFCDAFG